MIMVFFNINLFILLIYLGCVGSSLLHAGSERGLLFVAVSGLLTAVASLVAEHRFQVHGFQ